MVIVIGGGVSGMMAALKASKTHQVLLIDQNDVLGKKTVITGGGRCNFTSALPMEEFFRNVPRNPKFLHSAFSQWTKENLLDFVQKELKLKTVIEGHKIYVDSPVGGGLLKSALEEKLLKKNVKIHFHEKIIGLEKNHKGFQVKTDKRQYSADYVIIAVGGNAYPSTGSDGNFYPVLRKLGHRITPIYPSLTSLETQEEWAKDLMGISLVEVVLHWEKEKRKGPIVFTHYGVSGPLIIDFSSYICHKISKEPVKVTITPKSTVPRRASHVLQEDVPISMTFTKARGFGQAMVTRGGVDISQVNPSTMESKQCPGLYFCGEILDVDGLSGGFNLQIAFSTGYVAGKLL